MKRFGLATAIVFLLQGCAAEIDGPTPVITKIEASTTNTNVICTCKDLEGQGCEVPDDVQLSIIGSGFAPLPVGLLADEPKLELPTVILRFQEDGTETRFDGVDPSNVPAGTKLSYKDGQTLVLDLSKAFINTMSHGIYDLVVINPNGNRGELKGALEVTLGPVLLSIDPNVVCNEMETEITLKGKHFREGATVLVDNTELTNVKFVDDETLKATVPQGLAEGTKNVRVTNPEGCFSVLAQALQIVPPPTLTGVSSTTVCAGGSVTLKGTGFMQGATTVTIGTTTYSGTAVTVTDSTTLTVNDLGPLAPGTYDVFVTNAGCNSNTLTQALTVVPGPIIVAVDPSTVYNQVDFPVAIFGSGFKSGSTVQLETSPPTQLTIVSVTDDRIDAIVPKGIAPGEYDLTVIGPDGCKYTFQKAIIVTDQLTVRVCGIDPPFGWEKERTDVTITSGDATTTGCPACPTCTKQFESTPRAWLDVNGTLQPLTAVAFVTATSLTGVVPEGLTVGGPYDLLVQNPDGGIGLLPKAFRVVSLPVPQIDSINPGDADTQYVGPLTLYGKNFRSQAKVEIITADGTKHLLTNDATLSGNGTQADTSLDVPTLGLAAGAYLVRLTNTDQNTYYDYSALAITNPSGNLTPWQTAATAMTTARRRHAMVSGRLSAAARFLYAIGGDGGASSSAPMSSVELCPLDKFGGTGDWVKQRYELKSARTALGATVQGRYLYVIGGQGSSAPLASVERAVILDPADAPEIDTFSISLGGNLNKGAWYYRVAAVMSSTHPDNPDGESLPSDPVIIHAIQGVKATLSWKPVTDAVHYRVYRTAKENGKLGEEQLLADNVTATTYEDSGGAIADPNVTPLVKGSTGVFVELTATKLATARSAFSTIKATAGGANYVYVVGGRAGSAVLDTIELATITADGVTLGAFAVATTKLTQARERLVVGVADQETSPSVPLNTVWLYTAGGANNGALKDGDVSTIGANGQAGTFTPVAAFKSVPIAATAYMVNDTFYYFGGSDDGTTAQTSGFSCSYTNNPAPPQFKNCNNLGPAGTLPAATMNAALALESAFFYISGGGATDTAATDNVFKTVY